MSDIYYLVNDWDMTWEPVNSSTDWFTMHQWASGGYVVIKTTYPSETINYTINYYNNTTLLNISQNIYYATRQRIHQVLYSETYRDYIDSGIYGPWELGDTYIYSNETFNLQSYSLTGYTSLQWNTSSDLTGTNYALSASYTTNCSVDFYLKKTPITYTVSYVNNSGTTTGTVSTSATYDASFTLPTITKANYTFYGWYTDAGFTSSSYTGTFTWTLPSNTTFYAKFIINGYDLTFNTYNKGGITGAGTTKTYSTVISGTLLTTTSTPANIPIPKAVGLTFRGWYDSTTLTLQKILSDGFGGYTMPSAATTLYGKWDDNVSVKFSNLQNTFGGNNPIKISAYQSTISKTGQKTSLSLDFKNKGPNL